LVVKQIKDGVGNVENLPRGVSMFLRTTREKEFNLALPNNGPSPHPNKFSPKFDLVHSNAAFVYLPQSDQPRFALAKDTIRDLKRKVNNPRFDEHEGEHILSGRNPNCQTCKAR
jgi:hypothetical protein